MLTSPLFAKRTSGACTSTVSADPISGARAEVWGQTTAIIALTCGFAGRRRRASASWMPGKRACRVKKLDRRSDLAVRQLADLPSHCPDALGPSGTGLCVGYSVRCGLDRSEEHTSELQSHHDLVCRLLLEKK